VVFEFVELMGVVQTHCSAKDVLDESANEMFVQYLDLEDNQGLMVSGMGRGRCWVREVLQQDIQAILEVYGIIFQPFYHMDVLKAGFAVAGPDVLCTLDLLVLFVVPLEVLVYCGLLEAPDLLDEKVGPLFEALDIHWQDDLEIRDGTGHFSNLLEDDVVTVGCLDD
jgi:hypothetical protein